MAVAGSESHVRALNLITHPVTFTLPRSSVSGQRMINMRSDQHK